MDAYIVKRDCFVDGMYLVRKGMVFRCIGEKFMTDSAPWLFTERQLKSKPGTFRPVQEGVP